MEHTSLTFSFELFKYVFYVESSKWFTESFLEFKELISQIYHHLDEHSSTFFSKFAERKAATLEYNTAYLANYFRGSDYMSIASSALGQTVQILLRKSKNCLLYNT